MAPAATFAAYAIKASIEGSPFLDTSQIFSSVALIALVSSPTSRLLQAVPDVISSGAGFTRIQQYLSGDMHIDQRIMLDHVNGNSTSEEVTGNLPKVNGEHPTSSYEVDDQRVGNIALQLKGLTLRPSKSSDLIVSGVDLTIDAGTITAITGRVGSGKTTLLRAILGEIAFESGAIYVRSKVMAYCAQTPWLIGGTIKDVICSSADFHGHDEDWYQTVLEACALRSDLDSLPLHDNTMVASRGSSLSGGQKHRVRSHDTGD